MCALRRKLSRVCRLDKERRVDKYATFLEV